MAPSWLPTEDAAQDALFWPFRQGLLALPDAPVLFLGARPGEWMFTHPPVDWRCEQSFLPFAQALRDRHIRADARLDDVGFSLTLGLPPRQREESRALLARAVLATRDGGRVVFAATNAEGARSLESDLRALVGMVQSQSKYKSRVVWGEVTAAQCDRSLLTEWAAFDAPCEVTHGDMRFWTRPGLFAWDRVDPASALLAEHLPASLSGAVADLGAGWGYLSLQVLQRCPDITVADLFEANARALEPAQRNLDLALSGRSNTIGTVHWHDVTCGLPQSYDIILSNPPFHVGRADLPQLGRAFLRVAAEALNPHGQVWLVANRHLPYESLLAECFGQVDHITARDGYKVIRAREPKR
ncbi:class I SAM-dependent methyltransferase [Xanthomonadaceae bacterium XH05]|nr:class I SAM-dependent methyltransferase [Xanthomonadaceae bacterium XH05]